MHRTGLILLLIAVATALAACSSTPPMRNATARLDSAWQTTPNLPVFIDHSTGKEEVSIQAMSLVGTPYRSGGNTPDSGFDCSGLVRYVVARAAKVTLPRTTEEMSAHGIAVEPGQVASGDLIFFNTNGRPHSHVGIYVGKYRFVNAPSSGGTVRLDSLINPYWARHFDGIRRIVSDQPGLSPSPSRLQATSPADSASPMPLLATPAASP